MFNKTAFCATFDLANPGHDVNVVQKTLVWKKSRRRIVQWIKSFIYMFETTHLLQEFSVHYMS